LNGVKIPWFAASWAEEFAKASITDRALLSVARMQDSMLKSIDEINAAGQPMLVVSFEDSVLNTEKSIKLLEQFLDRPRTKRTKRVLKQQNLPRTQISAGKATSSFSFNSDSLTSEAEIYKKITNEITATGSPSAVQEFKSAISKYNLCWPSPLTALEDTWV
jgi:hypothetical protein